MSLIIYNRTQIVLFSFLTVIDFINAQSKGYTGVIFKQVQSRLVNAKINLSKHNNSEIVLAYNFGLG